MADVIARREFRYQDDRTKQVITVRHGERLPVEHLMANRVDIEKMVRTGYAERSEVVVAAPRKRGRPRKSV
jgi:hypothetical protein